MPPQAHSNCVFVSKKRAKRGQIGRKLQSKSEFRTHPISFPLQLHACLTVRSFSRRIRPILMVENISNVQRSAAGCTRLCCEFYPHTAPPSLISPTTTRSRFSLYTLKLLAFSASSHRFSLCQLYIKIFYAPDYPLEPPKISISLHYCSSLEFY